MASGEGVSEGLALLQKLGNEEAERFVHGAVSGFCEKEGVSYEGFASKLSLAEYKQLKQSLSNDVLQAICRDGITREEVSKRLQKLGASAESADLVAKCLWVRREEVKGQLVRDSCRISQSYLSDFDWRLKLVMSSDKLSSIQQPVVSLDLTLATAGRRETENIELSREELATLITSLEAANRVVTQLRT